MIPKSVKLATPQKLRPVASEAAGEPRRDIASFKALPATDVDEVIGLCEVVQEHGGCMDFYELSREFGYIKLPFLATEGAKMLGLVKTHEGEVSLTPLGRTWLRGNASERRRLFLDQMENLKVVRWICTLMRDSDNCTLSEGYVLNEISSVLPREEAQSTFWTLVNWGSYARLFDYREDAHLLVLRPHPSAPSAVD